MARASQEIAEQHVALTGDDMDLVDQADLAAAVAFDAKEAYEKARSGSFSACAGLGSGSFPYVRHCFMDSLCARKPLG
jgi:hypothetical protein